MHDNSKINNPILTKFLTHNLQVMAISSSDFGINRIIFEFFRIFFKTQFSRNRFFTRKLHHNSKTNNPIITKLHTHILLVMGGCPIDLGINIMCFEFFRIFFNTAKSVIKIESCTITQKLIIRSLRNCLHIIYKSWRCALLILGSVKLFLNFLEFF